MAVSKNKSVKKKRSLDFTTGWGYAPAPESKDHIQLKNRYDLFINGKFVAPDSGKYFDAISPATEQKLSEVADANSNDVDKAVKAARTAYEKVYIFYLFRLMNAE